MKKKTEIHIFENGIYPIKMYVYINPTEESLKRDFCKHDMSDCAPYGDIGDTMICVCYSVVCNRANGEYGVLVSVFNRKLSVDTIAHEATHVANRVWNWIGEQEPSEEANAYLVGHAAKCIYNAIKNI